MNKIIKTVLVLLCFLAALKNTRSQIQFFDSVKTVISSSTYDFRNPVFNNANNNFTQNLYSWIVYERHNGNYSDIVIRKCRYSSYDSEIVITNTSNALNINPSIDRKMLVWQSNTRGNWDIYCSVLSEEGNWSPPFLLDTSSSDQTNPCIKNNGISTVQDNFSYLAYKENNSIRMKRYKTDTGIWDNDTVITSGSDEYITPVLMHGNFTNQSVVYFLKKYPGGITKLNQRIFYDNYAGGAVTMENVFEIYQPNQQDNLSISFPSSEFLTYSYDTLSSRHILISILNGQNFKGLVTKNVPGKHIRGKGSLMPIITDDIYFQFSAFSSLSKYSDSLCFAFIKYPSAFNNNPEYKKVYLGDTAQVIKFDVSQPIFNQSYYYRIKTVWEKTSGGRTSLVESYMTDYLSGISNNNSAAEGFYLKQNYPNPFNPSTNLGFGISDWGFVSLKVYDALGKVVRTLVNEYKPVGFYSVEFDGSDLPSGIYFYRLEAGKYSGTKRMILLK
ncbi:MAG TPA: T9SS type A sorting domain-containing protein [Ignavibacteria bacterium]|nr:T9SS type A sorting domain-containing protein [Ignavibacteria bacterium]